MIYGLDNFHDPILSLDSVPLSIQELQFSIMLIYQLLQ